MIGAETELLRPTDDELRLLVGLSEEEEVYLEHQAYASETPNDTPEDVNALSLLSVIENTEPSSRDNAEAATEELVERDAFQEFVKAHEELTDLSGEPLPRVMVVSEMIGDAEACNRAERVIRSAGSAVVGHEVVASNVEEGQRAKSEFGSLMEAIYCARDGDEVARKLVRNNVRTDVIERTIKAGHIMEVDMAVNAEGKIVQYGQLMDDVHSNALRYASGCWQVRGRSEAETRNGARIEGLHRNGFLQDYYFVVLSRYADNMTDTEAERVGFFKETRSCAIQATTAIAGGGLRMESAFVAGVAEPDGVPHDEGTIVSLAAGLGADLSNKTATEVIDTPLLIHKSLLPNGVIDLVKYYDVAAGGTFFGERKSQQDYHTYRKQCREREIRLESVVQEIIDQLLQDANTMRCPTDATKRLHQLSQQKMVDYAIKDKTINPRVFGNVAAAHIEDARFWFEQGAYDRFLDSRNSAQETAHSSSCPTDGAEDLNPEGRGDDDTIAGLKKMHCPFCNAPVVADPCAKILRCWDCGACAEDGKIRSKGDGGHKVRLARLEAQAEQRDRQAEIVAPSVDTVSEESEYASVH